MTQRIHCPFQPKQSPSVHYSNNSALTRWQLLCLRHIRCPLLCSHTHLHKCISTVQWDNPTPPCCDRNSAECITVTSYSYIALVSAALLEQHPCRIALAGVYPLRLSSQDSVDAAMDQALISPPILPPKGKHGGYGTWQLMTSEEGFQAAQNVYWWLAPFWWIAATSVYLVCHPLHLCTGILGLLLLRLICQRVYHSPVGRFQHALWSGCQDECSHDEYPRSCITAEGGMSKQQIVANCTSQHSLHILDVSASWALLYSGPDMWFDEDLTIILLDLKTQNHKQIRVIAN